MHTRSHTLGRVRTHTALLSSRQHDSAGFSVPALFPVLFPPEPARSRHTRPRRTRAPTHSERDGCEVRWLTRLPRPSMVLSKSSGRRHPSRPRGSESGFCHLVPNTAPAWQPGPLDGKSVAPLLALTTGQTALLCRGQLAPTPRGTCAGLARPDPWLPQAGPALSRPQETRDPIPTAPRAQGGPSDPSPLAGKGRHSWLRSPNCFRGRCSEP